MKKTLLILTMFLLLTACKTAMVQQYDNVPIDYSNRVSLNLNEVESAIALGGNDAGWDVKPIKSGHVEATYAVKTKHVAVVDIFYTATSYDIHYKSSKNLKYDGTKIHKAYNKWVAALQGAIDRRLAIAHYK